MPLSLRLFTAFLFLSFACFAQVPALERELSFSVQNENAEKVLGKIQEQAHVTFSYASGILKNVKPLTRQFKKNTVREVLLILLPVNISFKAKGEYIILKEVAAEKVAQHKEVSGYVYDKNTHKKLSNVTVYDKNTLQVATTDKYGFYSLPSTEVEQCITVNKENFKDTCVALQIDESKLFNIEIDSLSTTVVDSVPAMKSDASLQNELVAMINESFQKTKGFIHTINVKSPIDRNFQFSVLPYVGSNGLLSGAVYNRFSLNLLGGYSKGTRGLEAASLFNINRENMSGVQLSGLFNVVGDTVKGLQCAGLFNASGKEVMGFQAAGLFNVSFGKIKGVAAAGLMNISADESMGMMAAGLFNVSIRSSHSLEAAGLFNATKHGLHNMQLSGLVNHTTSGSSFLQVSGLINMADHLSGLQIGMINVADSASGIPVGLLSVVRKGVHQLEMSTDEWFPANVSFLTGVPHLHNIFTAGFQPFGSSRLWHFGYGLGSSIKLKNSWKAELNATAHHVSKGSVFFGTSGWYKVYMGVEKRFGKRFSMAVGPTFNWYIADSLLPSYNDTYYSVVPYHLSEMSLPDGYNLKFWVGGRLALRFF
ncbi:MAG: hypothetical protein ACKOXB_04850 [Flavobacteriales bacterium]